MARYAETKILKALRFSRDHLYESYLDQYSQLKKKAKDVRRLGLTDLQEKSRKHTPVFRIDMPEIFHLLVRHDVSRFRYTDEIYNREREITYSTGYIPAYCPTMDIFTVLRDYGDLGKRTQGMPEDILEIRQKEGKKATYSSINAILEGETSWDVSRLETAEMFGDYLKYFFWSYPSRGYSSCPQITWGGRRIRNVFKLTKTLFSIDGFTKIRIRTGGQFQEMDGVVLSGLVKTRRGWRMRQFDAIMTKDIAPELRALGKNALINGIVMLFIRPGQKFNAFTLLSNFVEDNAELLAAVFGIAAIRLFLKNKSVISVDSLKSCMKEMRRILKTLGKRASLPHTVADGMGRESFFKFMFQRLQPIFCTDNNQVYCMHPALASNLEATKYSDRIKSSKENLLDYIRLAEKLQRDVPSPQIEEAKSLESLGVRIYDFSPSTARAGRYVRFSKCLRSCY